MGLALALGSVRAATLWTAAGGADRLPQWDPAKYGLDGLRLTQAIAAGDLAELVARLNALAVWPPVFPLLEVPAFALLGPGFRTPELLVATLFALLVGATAAAGVATVSIAEVGDDRLRGAAGGLLAAALVAASPLVQVHATLTMLEVPGALAACLAFAAWVRAERSGRPAIEHSRDARLAAVASTVLFFTKTNYAALWLGPLALFLALRRAGGPLALARAVLGWLHARPRTWPRPGTILLAGAGLAVAAITVAIRLGDGIDLVFGGVEIHAHSLGNPLYAFYVLAVLVLVARRGETVATLRRWAASSPLAGAFMVWTALPIALWLLIPPHLKEVVGFFDNRDSGIPLVSVEGLAFYVQAFVRDYAPSRAIGVAALALVALSAARWRRLEGPRRLLVWVALADLALATLHGYKLDRFLLTTTPLLWLVAALEAVDWTAAGAGRLGLGRRASIAAAALAALGAVAVLTLEVDAARLALAREARTVPSTALPLLDALAAEADEPVVLLGTWNGLSPALVEWSLRQRRPRPSHLPADRRALGRRKGLMESLAAAPPGRRVAVLEATAEPAAWTVDWRAAYAAETAWLDPLRDGFASLPGWVLERDLAPAGSGYRLRVFRRDPEAAGGGSGDGSSSPRSRS